MSLQICPKCHKLGITWYFDEEIDPDDRWFCRLCQFDCNEKEYNALTAIGKPVANLNGVERLDVSP